MNHRQRMVAIPAGDAAIEGMLELPEHPRGVVLFAHGSGSSRLSPRNTYVAGRLREAGFATLLMDLLTPVEDRHPALRFDIVLLASRLGDAMDFLAGDSEAAPLPIGLFGASTGAAAALRVAANRPRQVAAVVSRGGRPDLAGDDVLSRVKAPTLLIVGGLDAGVIELNQEAYRGLAGIKELTIVPGATHLFEEPGALEAVAEHAGAWFSRHLRDGGKR